MTSRPDYARVRRFLARGGHLQRDSDYSNETTHWRSALRDGTGFAAETCQWLADLDTFVLDGKTCRLAADRPGIYHLERLGEPTKESEPDPLSEPR
jgi:hypothetical protein